MAGPEAHLPLDDFAAGPGQAHRGPFRASERDVGTNSASRACSITSEIHALISVRRTILVRHKSAG